MSGLARPSTRLESLLSTLHSTFVSANQHIEALESTFGDLCDEEEDVKEDMADAQREWNKISRQYAAIEDEMKEDGWLVRFRT